MNFQIQHNMLTGLLLAAAKNDVRHYLNGVFLEAAEDNKIVGVTTDGHIMAVAWEILDLPEGFEKLLIPRDAIERLPKRKSGQDYVTVSIGKENASLEYDGLVIHFTPIEGRFPDWRAITPSKLVDRTESQFNPSLVFQAHKVIGKLAGLTPAKAKALEVRLDYSGTGDSARAVVRSKKVEGAFVIVMSWRVDKIGDVLYVPAPKKGGE